MTGDGIQVARRWLGTAPFCHLLNEGEDTRCRFSLNVNKMCAHCFNCSWSGSIVSVVATLNKITYAEALDIVNEYESYKPLPQNIFDEVFEKLILEDVEIAKDYIPLPNDFEYLSDTKLIVQKKPFLNYAHSRLLTDKQIKQHGVGFCPEGKIKFGEKEISLRNRLIMQVYNDDGISVYWNARDITGRLKPKSLNPPKGVNTINKSDVVFNLNTAKKKGMCIICEGIFDSITFGDYGVALFGKTISAKQLLQIVNSGIEDVYVALDSDAFGDALKLCDLLYKYISNVYLVKFEGGKDPNEIAQEHGKKYLSRFLVSAEKYDKFTKLKYKLLG